MRLVLVSCPLLVVVVQQFATAVWALYSGIEAIWITSLELYSKSLIPATPSSYGPTASLDAQTNFFRLRVDQFLTCPKTKTPIEQSTVSITIDLDNIYFGASVMIIACYSLNSVTSAHQSKVSWTIPIGTTYGGIQNLVLLFWTVLMKVLLLIIQCYAFDRNETRVVRWRLWSRRCKFCSPLQRYCTSYNSVRSWRPVALKVLAPQ